MLYIILIEPEHPGNIGAIARLMANFDLKNLILINPQADHLCEEAICRAKHAKPLLKSAKVKSIDFLKEMDYKFGTTAKLGSKYNIPRLPIQPEQISIPKNCKTAIIFGRESKGLLNEEIELCDRIINIPTSKKYGVLNLSHAASIIFYAISNLDTSPDAIESKEKEKLLTLIEEIADNLKFSTPEKRKTQSIVWKRVLGSGTMTKRDAYAIFGLFKKLYEKIKPNK